MNNAGNIDIQNLEQRAKLLAGLRKMSPGQLIELMNNPGQQYDKYGLNDAIRAQYVANLVDQIFQERDSRQKIAPGRKQNSSYMKKNMQKLPAKQDVEIPVHGGTNLVNASAYHRQIKPQNPSGIRTVLYGNQ
jgi:D-alanyl-D-alanine carboxypeptidase